MFIIVEKQDVGSRDTEWRYLIATDSVYGGNPFPAFSKKEDADEFIANRDDNFYRNFEAMELVDA